MNSFLVISRRFTILITNTSTKLGLSEAVIERLLGKLCGIIFSSR